MPEPAIPARDQRWEGRREFLIDRRNLFAPARYTVDLIDHGPARNFILAHHYATTFPTSVFRVGLFEDIAPGRARLVGIANFGNPANDRAISFWTGLGPREGLELNRFCLAPSVGFTGESWFLARALRRLREERPEIGAVLSTLTRSLCLTPKDAGPSAPMSGRSTRPRTPFMRAAPSPARSSSVPTGGSSTSAC